MQPQQAGAAYELDELAAVHPHRAPSFDAPPRVRRAVLAMLGLLTLANLLGTAFAPYLLARAPWILILLSPEGRHVVLATPILPAIPLIAAAALRRLLGLAVSYGIGAIYGDAAVRWIEQRYPRFGAFVRFLERQFVRFGAVLLIVAPLHSISILAGAGGTKLLTFLGAALAGQIVLLAGTYLFGNALSAWTEPLLAFISENVIATTLVCVALVALQQVISRVRRRRGPRAAE